MFDVFYFVNCIFPYSETAQTYSSISILISPGADGSVHSGEVQGFTKRPLNVRRLSGSLLLATHVDAFGLSVRTTACGWVSAGVQNGW